MARWRMALSQIRYLRVNSADVLDDVASSIGISAYSRLSCKGTMVDVGRIFREFVMVPGDRATETWAEDANGFVFRFNVIKSNGATVSGSVYVLAQQ